MAWYWHWAITAVFAALGVIGWDDVVVPWWRKRHPLPRGRGVQIHDELLATDDAFIEELTEAMDRAYQRVGMRFDRRVWSEGERRFVAADAMGRPRR